MATALTFGGILLALASGILACVALMPPSDYRLVTAPEGAPELAVVASEESGEADPPRSGEQIRLGALAVVLAAAAALTQLAAALI